MSNDKNIQKMLTRADDYCQRALNIPANYILEDRVAYAQIADACTNLARVMIEYERWQEERFKAERDEILAQRKDESPF